MTASSKQPSTSAVTDMYSDVVVERCIEAINSAEPKSSGARHSLSPIRPQLRANLSQPQIISNESLLDDF